MKKKQLAILAVVSGLIVCGLFMYFFRSRMNKIVLILLSAAAGMLVAEVIIFVGRKKINRNDISN